MLLLVLLACDPEEPRVEGQEVGDCTNGADDDADGTFDCDDDGCAASPDCDGDTDPADTDTDTDTDTDSDTDADTDADTDTDTDTDTDADADTDTDTDTDPTTRWSGATELPEGPSLLGEDVGHAAGWSLDVGDFDGDGQDDVAVGAPYHLRGWGPAGEVYVVHGPITSDVPLSTADANLTTTEYLYLGYSVRFAGDLDGDGAEELVIGAPTIHMDYGRAYVVSAFTGSRDVETADRWTGEDFGDAAGMSVDDAGDVDGDGVHDVIIGAGFSEYTEVGAGAAYVVYGPASGDNPLGFADTRIYGTWSQLLGSVVAGLGDLDGDGNDDFTVQATGGYRVYLGPATGILSVTDADAMLTIRSGSKAPSMDGGADVDGDGTPDVVAGYGAAAGGVVVVSGTRISGTVDLAAGDAVITGDTTDDELGTAVRVGDIDADGFADVLAGAPGTDPHGDRSGSLYLFYGDVTGSLTASDADARFDGDYADWQTGGDLAWGDVTGDGVLDLVIGSYGGEGDVAGAGTISILPGTL